MKKTIATLLTLSTCSIGAAYAQNTQDNCQYFGEAVTTWQGTAKGTVLSTKSQSRDPRVAHKDIRSQFKNGKYYLELDQLIAALVRNKTLNKGKIEVTCQNGRYKAEVKHTNPNYNLKEKTTIEGTISANKLTLEQKTTLEHKGTEWLSMEFTSDFSKK
jgi:hypothetical protein